MNETTYVRITFGFDRNKFGQPKFYRKGQGKDLTRAIYSIFKQKGNNYMPLNQRNAIILQINMVAQGLEKLTEQIYKKEGKNHDVHN